MNITLTEQLVFEECSNPYILQVTDEYRYFRLGCFIFELCYFLVGTVLFIKRLENKHIVVRTKYSFVLASIVYLTNAVGRSLMDYSLNIPSTFNSCNVFISLSNLSSALVLGAIGIRVYMYYNGYKLYKAIAVQYSKKLENDEDVQIRISKWFYRTSDGYANKLLALVLAATALFMFIFQVLTCPNNILPNVTCSIGEGKRFLQYVLFSIIGFLFLIGAAYKTKKYPDPFGILFELRSAITFTIFFLLVGTISSELLEPTAQPTVPVTTSFLSFTLGHFVMFTMLVLYPCYLTCKRNEIDITLEQVLQSPEATKLFEKHLERECSLENLNCYRAILRFEELYKNADSTAISTFAHNIQRKFISMETAEFPVNLKSTVRDEVTAKIKNEQISLEMFSAVKKACMTFLMFDIFPRFQRGPYYSLFIGLSDRESLERLMDTI